MVWRRLGLGSFGAHQGWVLAPLGLEPTQGFRLAPCFSSFNTSHLRSTKLSGQSPGGLQPFPSGGRCFAVELKFPQRLKLGTLAAKRILLFISTYCFDLGTGHRVKEISTGHLRPWAEQSHNHGLQSQFYILPTHFVSAVSPLCTDPFIHPVSQQILR